MNFPTRLAALFVLLTLAACGKMGPPEAPPGSTWPKGYPAGAIAHPVSGLVNSGNDDAAPLATTTAAAAATTVPGSAFTKSGAWIDPNMRRPVINPTADLDKWHLTNGASNTGY